MNVLIETENLGKRYGDVRAVDGLSMQVAQGEIYAFLGLNGAGKTTTIRMLLGMIKPSSGTAHVMQTRVRLGRREPWAAVGYLVETPHSYPELTENGRASLTLASYMMVVFAGLAGLIGTYLWWKWADQNR